MFACPVQHGLSHCFSGSLSSLFDNLSADKEHLEQSSASQSSSSTDLDEDQSELKGELGSLNFQCHSVLPDPSTASEDDFVTAHVPCKGEVPDSGGELRVLSLHPANLPQTEKTSKPEELQNTTRTIFLQGCAASAEAKGKALKTPQPSASNQRAQHELDPHELPQTTWQHPALSVTSLHEHEEQRRPLAQQASHQQPGRSKRRKKRSRKAICKLHRPLAQPRSSPAQELEGTASPGHSLLLELEVSKSAAGSGALLSVLSEGQQVSSASSFPTAITTVQPAKNIAR